MRARFRRVRVFWAGLAAAPVASVLIAFVLVLVNMTPAWMFFTLWFAYAAFGVVLALPVCLVCVFAFTFVAEHQNRTDFASARYYGAWIGGVISVILFASLLFLPTIEAVLSGEVPDQGARTLADMIGLIAVSLAFFPICVIIASVARAVMGEPQTASAG